MVDLRSFELTTKKSVENELRTEALLTAQSKASAMASVYKNSLGRPIVILDGELSRRDISYRETYPMVAISSGQYSNDTPSIDVDFQKIKLYSNVTVTFELLP